MLQKAGAGSQVWEQRGRRKKKWSEVIFQNLPDGTKGNHEIPPARCAKDNICTLERLRGNRDNYNRQPYNFNFKSRQLR
jgi:hypothetical protein